MRLILFIVVPIAGVLLIVGIVVFVRSRTSSANQDQRVGFHDYMQMADRSRAPNGPPPANGNLGNLQGGFGTKERDPLL